MPAERPPAPTPTSVVPAPEPVAIAPAPSPSEANANVPTAAVDPTPAPAPSGPQPTIELAIAPNDPSVEVLAERRIAGVRFVLYARSSFEAVESDVSGEPRVADAAELDEEAWAALSPEEQLRDALADAESAARTSADIRDALSAVSYEVALAHLLRDTDALQRWLGTLAETAGDDCDGEGSFSRWNCTLAHSETEAGALRRFDPQLRQIGIARIEGREGSFQVLRDLTLFAYATVEAGGDWAPHLTPGDPDGDGQVELTAVFRIALPRDDEGMGGLTTARVYYVVDQELRVQVGIGTLLEDSVVDVGGTRFSSTVATSFADANADGHPDLHLAERCVTTEIDDEDMSEHSSRARNEYDCLYTAEDRWDCPALPNDIVGGAGQSIVSARGLVQPLPAADPNHGFSLPEVRSQIRAELERRRREEADLTDTPVARPEAPEPPSQAPQRDCAWVVADPNPPLRVRAEANARSPVVGELANGTQLTLGERRGGFAHIETPHAGWVWSRNLREAHEGRGGDRACE